MRDRINANDIANSVMMLRSAFKGTIVIVEGSTDSRLYGKFLDEENTETVIAHCRQNVYNSVKEVSKRRGDERLIGIIDSDLDHMNGIKRSPPLFQTDARDSEGMLFLSKAFDDVLFEYADKERLDDFRRRHGNPKDAIYSACYPIGILMMISSRDGLNLSFKDLVFEHFLDRRSLKCDIRRMCEHILDRSNGAWISLSKLVGLVFDEPKMDPVIACRGHDIADVFAFALREIFGGYNARTINGYQVAGAMRIAYDREDFDKTVLYATSDAWASGKDMPLWDKSGIVRS